MKNILVLIYIIILLDKIDIWSLGCIAVEILCGTALFPCAEEFSCLERIITVLNPKISNNNNIYI